MHKVLLLTWMILFSPQVDREKADDCCKICVAIKDVEQRPQNTQKLSGLNSVETNEGVAWTSEAQIIHTWVCIPSAICRYAFWFFLWGDTISVVSKICIRKIYHTLLWTFTCEMIWKGLSNSEIQEWWICVLTIENLLLIGQTLPETSMCQLSPQRMNISET